MNLNLSTNINKSFGFDTNLQEMNAKISECIDELALLLDQIYKFPQKQREHYYDRIQSMKNRLIHLRNHLK